MIKNQNFTRKIKKGNDWEKDKANLENINGSIDANVHNPYFVRWKISCLKIQEIKSDWF